MAQTGVHDKLSAAKVKNFLYQTTKYHQCKRLSLSFFYSFLSTSACLLQKVQLRDYLLLERSVFSTLNNATLFEHVAQRAMIAHPKTKKQKTSKCLE